MSSRPTAVSTSFSELSRDFPEQKCKVSCTSVVRDLVTRPSSNCYHHVGEAALREIVYLAELDPISADPNPGSHIQTILQENNVFRNHDRSSLDPRLHLQ